MFTDFEFLKIDDGCADDFLALIRFNDGWIIRAIPSSGHQRRLRTA